MNGPYVYPSSVYYIMVYLIFLVKHGIFKGEFILLETPQKIFSPMAGNLNFDVIRAHAGYLVSAYQITGF